MIYELQGRNGDGEAQQLSMCAERARDIHDRQAKERQKQSKGRGQKGVTNCPHLFENTGKSRDRAGKAFGVSGCTGG